uniref:Uncharacterized protein LOC113788586 isoform X2 n=1 Tax=Dermatophagoides pteronyssinus TaxID=6956 RepID=A0A6P6XM48_DERPT|nr:uncharacterized protein LOC113788586 isoform X2 [Dermatophagoides pteronyssinus]
MELVNRKVYFFLCIGLLIVFMLMNESVDAQKKRRNRNKNKNGADQCHQKEIIKCLDKLTSLGKEDDPTSIITTSQGIKDDTMKCAKAYFKKCGTPLHRELSDLVMDVIMHRVTQFCDNSQQKSRFLKHSPCFHSKVLRSNDFKSSCNDPFLHVAGKIDMNHLRADDVHEALCCGFNTWFECSNSMIKRECTAEGARVGREFHNNTLGPLTDLFCPFDVFPGGSSSCKRVMNAAKPKSGSKPAENTISKLAIQYVPFMFTSSSKN